MAQTGPEGKSAFANRKKGQQKGSDKGSGQYAPAEPLHPLRQTHPGQNDSAQ